MRTVITRDATEFSRLYLKKEEDDDFGLLLYKSIKQGFILPPFLSVLVFSFPVQCKQL